MLFALLAGGLLLVAGIGVAFLLRVETGLVVAVLCLGALALGALGGAAVAARRREMDRYQRLLDGAERLSRGELHVFVAAVGDDPMARLGAALNRLGDGVRADWLKGEQRRLLDQSMIRETPNGLLIVDGTGRIQSLNPAMSRLLPVVGEPLGRTAAQAVAVPELAQVLAEVAQTRVIAERTVTVSGRDLLVRGMPLADGVGCMGIVLDVTSLRAAERARRDFVANVSHELRTPVSALIGYGEALMDEREHLPPVVVGMVEAIDRNARRLHALVDDVLQLSKIEARAGDFPLYREALAPIVAGVAEDLAPRGRAKGITLHLDVPPALEARLNAEAFAHALGNLVDNAIKYTQPGGNVWVTARPEGAQVRVEVRDDGPGIAPEHHARIFERFYRGDPARSKAVPGTGLGLALVKHLCLAMEAEVRFESPPGEGSRFWLLVPG